MYTLYLAGIGEVSLRPSTLHTIGSKTYMLGHDSDNNRIRFTVDRVCVPKDQPNDCGYCHIISYTQGDTVTQCNIYKALH